MPAVHAMGQTFATPVVTGKDSYALVLGTQECGSTVDQCKINGSGAEWGLKMPDNRDSIISKTNLYGGRERALDIVRGGNLAFNMCNFGGGTDRKPTRTKWSLSKTCDVGAKGGVTGLALNECYLTDLLLGDFSIYDQDCKSPKASGIVLTDCRHPLGPDFPIIIRCLHAERPTLIRTNAVILEIPELIVQAYFALCRTFGDTRKPVAA